LKTRPEEMNRNDFSVNRLARQAKLLGSKCMQKLRSLIVTIIGCGRNGSFFSMFCAYAGIFFINLIDPDVVKTHNINASILFGYSDVNKNKAEVVERRLKTVDPAIKIGVFPCRVQDVPGILESSDVVISAVDSIATKNFLNSFIASKMKNGCQISLLDLASGSFVQGGEILLLGGQATLFKPGGACLQCGSLDEDEHTNLSNVSYIIPNGFSAILGLELLLASYDIPFQDKKDPYNFILYDCLSHQLVKLNRLSRPDCRFCGPG